MNYGAVVTTLCLVQMRWGYRPGAWHRWEGFTGLGPGTDGRALQAWGSKSPQTGAITVLFDIKLEEFKQ